MLSILAASTEAFGINHLIMAILCIIIMVLCPILIKKYDIPFKKITFIFLIIWIICELTKLLSNITYVMKNDITGELDSIRMIEYVASDWNNWTIARAYYPRGELPFHLCSIMPFFILYAAKTKNEKAREIVLAMIAPFGLVGSVISIALATNGADFMNPQIYEYFFYHAFLAVYALEIIFKREIKPRWYLFYTTVAFSLIMFIGSIWLNTILSDTGVLGTSNEFLTNFFYSMKPPLGGLPYLNMKHGWFVYFMHIVSLGLILVGIYYAIVINVCNKKNKEEKYIN